MTVKPIEVDRSALLELARGTNLYEDPFAPLRELLSNAVDATLLRIFSESGAAAFPTHENSLHELRSLLGAHPIEVRVETVGDRTSGHFEIAIRDHGTGIAAEDRRYLGLLGASHRNPARRALIDAMPEWMRPSGAFGIGLHSAFLITDELKLRTRHHAEDVPRTWVLRRDAEGVSLASIEDVPLEGVGTEVSLVVPRRTRAHFGRWVVAGMDRAKWNAFDLLFDEAPDHEALAAVGGVHMLGQGSLVPVVVNGEAVASAFDGAHASFDPASGVELTRIPGRARGPSWASVQTGGDPFLSDTFYRGAPVQFPLHHEPLAIRANLHFGQARALMNVSRDTIAARAEAEIRRRVRAAIDAISPSWMDPSNPLAAPEAEWPWISRALLRHGVPEPHEHWRSAVVLEMPRVTLGEVAREPWVECGPMSVTLPSHGAHGAVAATPQVARADLLRLFPEVRVLRRDPTHERWGTEGGATIEATREGLRGLRGTRATLACPDGYRALAVDLDRIERTWQGPRQEQLHHLDRGEILMLLPYVIREGTLRVPEIATWLRFVAEHALDGPGDPETLAPWALRFLVDFDEDVRAHREARADYSLEALRAALEIFGALPSIEDVRAELGAR